MSKGTPFERFALVLSVVGYGSLAASLLFVAGPGVLGFPRLVSIPLWLGCMAALWYGARGLSRLGRVVACEVLVLGVLPLWGSVINETIASPCRVDSCDDMGIFRPFASPEFFALLALHATVVLAYAVSRRRPEALPVWPEALVQALLSIGLGADALAAIQLVFLTPYLVALPLALPLLAPALSSFFFLRELKARLSRRGEEARRSRDHGARAAASWRRGALATMLVGAYALVHALVYGNVSAFARVFTRTCRAPFSFEVVELLHEKNCHYLCTVAAHGHPRLVKPERFGLRLGQRIVVNRQLCVANAFEDLLRARFPRAARSLRRAYDRLGFPLSRFIRTPLASDCVYLAMKPLEWVFYLALLLFDSESPELRIGRMYR